MPIIPEQRGPGIHIKSIEAEGNLSTRYYFGKRASIHLLAWGYDFRTAFASDVSNVPIEKNLLCRHPEKHQEDRSIYRYISKASYCFVPQNRFLCQRQASVMIVARSERSVRCDDFAAYLAIRRACR
jgi:hypothetical protein